MDNKHINDMTVGSPTRGIIHFALPLILGYILQQMYLIIDAAIVGALDWCGRFGGGGRIIVDYVFGNGLLQRFVRGFRHPHRTGVWCEGLS